MTYPSIIHAEAVNGADNNRAEQPDFFGDLNLDQVLKDITAGKEEYDLLPLFYRPLADIDSVRYRHEVWRDLENRLLASHVRSFAARMHTVRAHLAQVAKLHYELQKQSWILDEAQIYCEAVSRFVEALKGLDLSSRGFVALRRYLTDYVGSNRFVSLEDETRQLRARLATIKYAILIREGSFTVRQYEDEPDYSVEVEGTFAKFKQGAVKGYAAKFSDLPSMNHIEAKVLEFVARLNPQIFSTLADFCQRHEGFLDEAIAAFDREIQFYIAYQDYMSRLEGAGLKFCYPAVSSTDKEERSVASFDMALAGKLIGEKRPIVSNDYTFSSSERILVVSGPNQGGKTTFARTFGQLHYFASLGCPVPGSEARLFLFDRLFTHFEREEDIQTLRGKLEDDLFRIHKILERATSSSVVIINEIFNSTSLNDAIFLGKRVIGRISELDALCVCVTFIDELASFDEKTVSMASTVVPSNPALRTFKIIRKPADGLSYAVSIAEKYQLTYERVKERIKS